MAQHLSFGSLLAVAAVAFAPPLLLGLLPRWRVPFSVLTILASSVLGPVPGWMAPDVPVRVSSLVGLAFLLFFAGLKIDFGRLRGRLLKRTLLDFAASFVLALVASYGIDQGRQGGLAAAGGHPAGRHRAGVVILVLIDLGIALH